MTTHTGGCHCGAVRYQAEAEIKQGLECNCSICRKRGSILDFMPEKDFSLLQGEEHLTDYTFNTHRIHHLFCDACGVSAFAKAPGPDGTPMVALNLRCVDDLDLTTLKVVQYDGASK